MKNDLSSDYFLSHYLLNEYIPLNPSHSKEDLLRQFVARARALGLDRGESELLFEAFTHKSFAHESKHDLPDNERLEFLGDSVLQLAVSEKLMRLYPRSPEGKLSKMRSSIVNESALGRLAKDLGLGKLLMLGKGELNEKGHQKDSLLANCFEAWLGALYLSFGFEKTEEIIARTFRKAGQNGKDYFHIAAMEDFDAKSKLQEAMVKRFGEPPKYVCAETGDKKSRQFRISVAAGGRTLGELVHPSKKKGMQALAKKVLDQIQTENKK